jgi:hypothetical protein
MEYDVRKHESRFQRWGILLVPLYPGRWPWAGINHAFGLGTEGRNPRTSASILTNLPSKTDTLSTVTNLNQDLTSETREPIAKISRDAALAPSPPSDGGEGWGEEARSCVCKGSFAIVSRSNGKNPQGLVKLQNFVAAPDM